MRAIPALTGVLLATAISTGAHAANLLTNGSYEDATNFMPNGQNTMVLGVGSTAMPGWTVTSNEIAWIGTPNPFGFSASDGSYSLDLQSYSDSAPYGGVTQSIATVVGGQYQLTFDLGALNGTSQITASAGLTSQAFTTPNTSGFAFVSESLSFTATATTTLISLLGTKDSSTYIGLDNVSVTCVASCVATPPPPPVSGAPEPTTWALALLGVAGVGTALRYRRKAAFSPA